MTDPLTWLFGGSAIAIIFSLYYFHFDMTSKDPVNTPPVSPDLPSDGTLPPDTTITPSPAPSAPVEDNYETKKYNYYEWDTVEKARHSVRVICDEEGLTVKQKNELCATVGAESGWQSYYLSGPKKGQPVKLENKKNGVVWSTDWGIIQLNDHYWIGTGKEFPSVQYVLDNPEACIRFMCRKWKAGQGALWVAFKQKTPAYKKYYGLK